MYCTDEDGFYPVYTPQGDPLKWSGMLWEEGYVPDPIVYDCPSFNGAYNFASRDWSTSTSRDGIFNYPEFGYNHLWVGTKYRITGDRTQNRQVEIHTPSNTVLVCDTFRRDLWDDTELGYYIVQDSDGSPYQAHGRHFRSVNTAWLDGHVSTSGQVDDINHPTVEPNAALLRWPLEGNVWDGGQY
jgi:prepilin-type processing-associated H-X9-DG protein